MSDEQPPTLAAVAERLLRLQAAGWNLAEPLAIEIRAAYDELVAYERNRQRAMLEAVRGDLDRIDVDKVPGGRTHQALALHLASVIDKRGDDDGPSTTAKLADQLTKQMQLLTRKGGAGDDDGFGGFSDDISTPD